MSAQAIRFQPLYLRGQESYDRRQPDEYYRKWYEPEEEVIDEEEE